MKEKKQLWKQAKFLSGDKDKVFLWKLEIS